MYDKSPHLPVVLAIGGHDPGGGAGIQADIEAIAANGCHATTAVTCLTVQDSCNLSQLLPTDISILKDQISATLEDCRVATIKIGLVGSLAAAEAIVETLREHPKIPLVLDPVLAAGGGRDLSNRDLVEYLRHALIPLCRLLTPNTPEAARLAGLDLLRDYQVAADRLLELGTDAVLITGSHDPQPGEEIVHRLYQPSTPPMLSRWQRLRGEFHGSGCTLTSAIAARMAQQESLETAVEQGLAYTWSAISNGFKTGRCQAIPERLLRLQRGHRDGEK
ncbi:MAG: hydroxymethylpyrimidine/phosphomethylpyrimidine kinase [Candidatus Thiodiazotropha sp.]